VARATTVVVTRPGAAGRRLVDELARAGQPALWLPAFEFGAAPDEHAARAVLARLVDFDLAVFVSPQAVRATAALLAGPWPAATAIAAVGSGTRAALLAQIAGAGAATLFAPAGDDDVRGSGSESLWPLLQAMQPPPRRVLLLRAQSGREWLTERLQALGASVLPLAVYTRRAFVPSDELRRRLDAAASQALASVVSSSDAVEALAEALASQPDVLQSLREGPALASHARIAERLRSAGFRQVLLCAAEAGAVLAALRQQPPAHPAGGR
jgi:uroporphyrinogen-III synthase